MCINWIVCTYRGERWGADFKPNRCIMRTRIIIILCLFVIGCRVQRDAIVSSRAIFCLRDMLTGEDSGGTWSVVTEPVGANLTPLLIGDNPCIQWSVQPCGQYELRYVVGDACCRDTSYVRPRKCCLEVAISCE